MVSGVLLGTLLHERTSALLERKKVSKEKRSTLTSDDAVTCQNIPPDMGSKVVTKIVRAEEGEPATLALFRAYRTHHARPARRGAPLQSTAPRACVEKPADGSAPERHEKY